MFGSFLAGKPRPVGGELHFTAVVAGLAKFWNRQYHRPPLSKALDEGLFELRHVGKSNTRVLYFFMQGRRIIAVHGIRNKAMKIPTTDFNLAMERRRDWLARNPR